jgi:glutamyl-tRNA synthetase
MAGAEVRVRYAPSPTGYPHVGNIRTAFFNWLMARHYGGSFIVRIEDTDVARRVGGAISAILDGLRWLGLDWDEGPEVGGKHEPYFQSQRLKFYQEAAQQLVKGGDAYPCYCSPERLEAMRAEQRQRKQPPGYDRYCRELSKKQRSQFGAQGITPVIRFKTPLKGETSFTDLTRGEITFQNNTLDDFVLLKSDGYPTYHLANVVDDYLMEITHVLRADEWVASTPRHILLYQALGYSPPQFAHLPMILGTDRTKLSKRHGAVSIRDYQEQGYLPEAMANFLALLGWALDDKTELFTREELIRYFSLERISKTPAIFNLEKLNWMNGVYLRKLSQEEFTRRAEPFLERDLPSQIKRPIDSEYLAEIMPLVQERAKTLSEIAGLVDLFFVDELDYPEELLLQKVDKEAAIKALDISLVRLRQMEKFDPASLEALLRPLASELGMKTGQFFGLLRVAVTGRTAAPPLFQTMAVLGKGRCLKRIETALKLLKRL